MIITSKNTERFRTFHHNYIENNSKNIFGAYLHLEAILFHL